MAAERPSDTVSTWSARPLVILILSGLTALGVVLVLVGVALPHIRGGSSDGDSAERNQVTARANDFAVAYNTYDVSDLAGYQKRLKGLLTPKYDAQFVQITNAVFDALKTKDQKSGDAKVVGVAIDSIDKDSADAIVAVDASITNTDNKAAVLRHFRWKVSFTKTKGEWLVDNFESVASLSAETGAATPTPTPSANGGDSQ